MSLFFRREVAAPMLALTFASAVSVVLVAARILLTGNIHYGLLIWNLFLAWFPLVFAVLAHECYRDGLKAKVRFALLTAAWLLFYPNAPYIFTDLIHLMTYFTRHIWVDLVLILLCAFTGLVIGFLSLYLMQTVVDGLFGRTASWFFVTAVTALGGFGIFLGRFLRLNSWDVLVNPSRTYREVGAWTTQSFYPPSAFAFPLLFATFLFVAYVMLYALTHLSPTQPARPPNPAAAL
jgi:uncharacterized membrane protein